MDPSALKILLPNPEIIEKTSHKSQTLALFRSLSKGSTLSGLEVFTPFSTKKRLKRLRHTLTKPHKPSPLPSAPLSDDPPRPPRRDGSPEAPDDSPEPRTGCLGLGLVWSGALRAFHGGFVVKRRRLRWARVSRVGQVLFDVFELGFKL